MKKIGFLCLMAILFLACKPKKEPMPKICTNKDFYSLGDTIMAENCSEHTTKIRWIMPNGAQSISNKVYFKPTLVGVYKFVIYASNDDFVNEYKGETNITVTP